MDVPGFTNPTHGYGKPFPDLDELELLLREDSWAGAGFSQPTPEAAL